MIKNRGLAKKWSGMMLPEHIHRLKEWKESMEIEYPKEKADWEWTDLQQKIMTAYYKKQCVTLRLWLGKWITEQGVITSLNFEKRQLIIDTEFSVKKVHFNEIDQVMVVNE